MPTDPIVRGLPADRRDVLVVIADRRGETMASLSRVIGKSEGYLARYVRDSVPDVLPANDRQLLARYLGVGDQLLA